MRIVLPFMDMYNRKIDEPRVSSGREMFCKLIKNDITTKENECQVSVVDIPPKDKRNKGYDYAEDILGEAKQHSVDSGLIIMCNYPETLFTGGRIIQSHVPIMVVIHNLYPFPSIIDRINDLIYFGHSVYLVSQYQYEYYSAMAKRLNKKIEISGFLNPTYAEERKEISKIKYECGTIGRCDNHKHPFGLNFLLRKSKMSKIIITSKPDKYNTDSRYLKDNIEYYNRQNQNDPDTLWDLPHKEVVWNISQCRTYFSSYYAETWDNSALEALSCGVPLILNAKKRIHSGADIASSSKHYKIISHNDEVELQDAIRSFRNVDRKEIQQMTLEKHSQHNWKVAIYNAIDKVIETFKKRRTLLKEIDTEGLIK